jgi:membrane protein
MSNEAGIIAMLKETVREFLDDDCMRLAAALSYYTVFSLPALLILILMVASVFIDPQTMQGQIRQQMSGLIGESGAGQIQTMIEEANRPDTGGPLAAILGIGALLFGATGAFMQLQAALNKAWDVAPDPEAGGIKNFIVKRFFSLAMILGVAFLLLVSLVLSAALGAFGEVLAGMLPGVSEILLHALQIGVSLALIAVLFAAMFKVLPDADIAWRDVWVGAVFTALLFVIGKYLIGLYLGNSEPGSAFGAAGSLAVLLVWIYYSALILFLGAEFTQVWAVRRGRGVEPSEGAIRASG